MENIIIGVYRINGGITHIMLNPETDEVFYNDDQDMPYVIFGCPLENPPSSDVSLADDSELVEPPSNIVGVIHDGEHKWLLTDDYKAYRVHADADDISGYLRVVDFSDDTEYEPVEDDI